MGRSKITLVIFAVLLSVSFFSCARYFAVEGVRYKLPKDVEIGVIAYDEGKYPLEREPEVESVFEAVLVKKGYKIVRLGLPPILSRDEFRTLFPDKSFSGRRSLAHGIVGGTRMEHQLKDDVSKQILEINEVQVARDRVIDWFNLENEYFKSVKVRFVLLVAVRGDYSYAVKLMDTQTRRYYLVFLIKADRNGWYSYFPEAGRFDEVYEYGLSSRSSKTAFGYHLVQLAEEVVNLLEGAGKNKK